MRTDHKAAGCHCDQHERQRAYQREYVKRRWHSDPDFRERSKASTARAADRRPRKPRTEAQRERSRLAFRARQARYRDGIFLRPQEVSRVCTQCGATFDPGRSPNGFVSDRRYCSRSCLLVVKRRVAIENAAKRPSRRTTFPSCLVYFVPCDRCGSLFTSRFKNAKRCSKECAIENFRTWQREYQRRTKATAIRYWRVAKTPEAEALAKEYYELRQALRQVRRQGVPTT